MSYQITEKEFNNLIGVKESYQAPTKLLEILYDKKLIKELKENDTNKEDTN